MGAEPEGANVRVRHGLQVLVTEYTTAASTQDWIKATPSANVNTSPGDNETVLLVPTTDDEELRQLEQLYSYTVPVLILLCAISVMINVRILVSVYWVRRPVSPTLHISLSLAGADAFASAIFGLGLALNSLLRAPLDPCVALVIEAFREAGIIVTVAHLLALAANHYLGILRPLHYLSIMTHRKTALSIAVLWLLPVAFFFTYFVLVEDQGFQTSDCRHDFMRFSTFRVTFSSLFFAPLILMLFIYTHIFFIVRRHQEGRLLISGVTHRCNTYSTQQNQQMARNVKAIYTTLLILGSYVVGLMPAVLIFVLVCEDCAFPLPSTTRDRRNMFFIYTFVNFLVILKTGVNPIIYAARMQEIKAANRRMFVSARRACCPCVVPPADADGDSVFNTEMSGLRRFSSSGRGSSMVCRLRSHALNGSVHRTNNVHTTVV